MNPNLQEDLNELNTLLEAVKNQASAYLHSLPDRPTSSVFVAEENGVLKERGIGTAKTLEEFNRRFEPVIVSSSGPRFLGFVTGGSTPASIAGDWLATIYDQNTQTKKGQGDISAVIESETVRLLIDLLGLPTDFTGGFVTGATMSNFTCLATARQWFGKEFGKDFAKDGISEKVTVFSAVPHSSVIKSLAMSGIGSNMLVKIKTQKGDSEAIDLSDLEARIKEIAGRPFILVSSAGTVNTADFDDFKAIAKLKETYRFWWHIDGAFGAFAACSPKFKHLTEGWEKADSLTVDCHKWLNVPYESALFFIKDEHRIIQTETFQNTNAPYLGDSVANFNYLNLLPENSRRLKALAAWFSLRAYGKNGYRDIVENSVAMANLLGDFIRNSDKFDLLSAVRLNNVCFSLKGAENQDKVQSFLVKLNATGKVFMTPTVYREQKGIRASFVNWRTAPADIELIIKEMNRLADF